MDANDTKGESYAGRYVPYISAQMLDQNDTKYYDISGIAKPASTCSVFRF